MHVHMPHMRRPANIIENIPIMQMLISSGSYQQRANETIQQHMHQHKMLNTCLQVESLPMAQLWYMWQAGVLCCQKCRTLLPSSGK